MKNKWKLKDKLKNSYNNLYEMVVRIVWYGVTTHPFPTNYFFYSLPLNFFKLIIERPIYCNKVAIYPNNNRDVYLYIYSLTWDR